jgi:hypothetical protein
LRNCPDAGYSAWLIVDASIELSPNAHQCSPELLAAGNITRTQETPVLWSLAFASNKSSASLNASISRMHGGFTLLVDFTYDSSAADQTLFSVGNFTMGFHITAAIHGSTQGYKFDFARSQTTATVISSAAVPAGRNAVAFRYQAFTDDMVIYSVAGNGSLDILAKVNPPLLLAICCVVDCQGV